MLLGDELAGFNVNRRNSISSRATLSSTVTKPKHCEVSVGVNVNVWLRVCPLSCCRAVHEKYFFYIKRIGEIVTEIASSSSLPPDTVT